MSIVLLSRPRRHLPLAQRLLAAAGGSTNVVGTFLYGVNATTPSSVLSAWADANGNGATLSQATGSKRALDSGSDYVFDGVDDFIKGSFTWTAPNILILVVKQIAFTSGNYIADSVNNTITLRQFNPSPGFSTNIGTLANNNDLPIGTYGVLSALLNGASSDTQVNARTAVTGAAQSADPGGLEIGAASNNTLVSNIAVKAAMCLKGTTSVAQRAAAVSILVAAYGVAP